MKRESFEVGAWLIANLIANHYNEEITFPSTEELYKVIEDKDINPNEWGEGSNMIIQRKSDSKYFLIHYVIRFDGDIRSFEKHAMEVERKERIEYYYE